MLRKILKLKFQEYVENKMNTNNPYNRKGRLYIFKFKKIK